MMKASYANRILGFTSSNIFISQFHRMAPQCSSVLSGKLNTLSSKIQDFVSSKAELCSPADIHICDGSEAEAAYLADILVKNGTAHPLSQLDNCYAVRTNPADVARVESKTVICSKIKEDAIPTPAPGVKGSVGTWADPVEMEKKLKDLFSGCMAGRTMYVIPFSMGPVGSPLAKVGIQVTDSPYVTLSMRVMTRMGKAVLDSLGDGEFVKCTHSVGRPLPHDDPFNWPCNPENTIITHFPERREIISFGSGYGGNSLLGKKCFALRIAMNLARDEGWLAEHMLILGLTNPAGEKRYIAAAFPSACGKTNLAMLTPTIPGWKAECVGDDIAWMKFDEEGVLRAINPENGFFGVAPGTSMKTNAEAMKSIKKNTVFTNVATTKDGGVFWEGLEKEVDLSNAEVTDWHGKPWTPESGTKAAHPNSRFCAPAGNCEVMDPLWEDPKGVPIDAILFGGRRPEGVPLVYEARDWNHGVFIGSSMCSEATAAAEHSGRSVMRDPMAMRPFFGYNAGKYFQHWLNVGAVPGRKMPKVFHVNWFRRGSKGEFLWPGFGENIRVLKYVWDRMEDKDVAQDSPVGLIPKDGAIDIDGLGELDMDAIMSVPKDYWLEQLADLKQYYDDQFGKDLPQVIWDEYHSLKRRLES